MAGTPELKQQIIIKIQALINSKEGLWREFGQLARSRNYTSKDFTDRLLDELDLLEKRLGKTEDVLELRDLIVSLKEH